MGSASLEELATEVRALRAALEHVRAQAPRRRLRLSPVHGARFLGQPLTINARLTDALTGAGVVDAPVTFISSSGLLSGADGYSHHEGKTITLRSGIDGGVRVTLAAETVEPLTAEQRHAFEAALALLDGEAPTPQKARAGLEMMAQEYRWEANYPLRQAIDIYFREHERTLVGNVNPRDHGERWRFSEGIVVAHARQDEEGAVDSEVEATAVLDVRFKNWVGAWFEAYLELSDQADPLGSEFERLKLQDRHAAPLLEGIYARTHDYVERQRGVVAGIAAQRTAQRSIETFIKTGTSDLALDERVRLEPALQAASGTLSRAGAAVIATLGQTQTTLRQEIRDRGGDPRLTDLESQVGTLKAQLTQKLDTSIFNAELARKVDVSTLNAELARKVDVSTLNTELARKVDVTAFNSELAKKLDTSVFNAEIGKKVDTTLFHAEIAKKVDSTTFQVELGKKLDSTRFQNELDRHVDRKLTTLRAEVNNTIEDRLRRR